MKKYSALLYATTLAVCAVIALFSLFSYHATDATWFSYASHSNGYGNVFGAFGASIAVIQLYLLGAVASVVLGVLVLWVAYRLVHDRSLVEHWERVVAGAFMCVSVAGLCSVLGGDLFVSVQPGGRLGAALASVLSSLVGTSFVYGALALFFLITFIITTRLSFVAPCAAGMRAVARSSVWPYVGRAAMKGVHFLVKSFEFFGNLVRGRAVPPRDYSLEDFEPLLAGALRDDDGVLAQEAHGQETEISDANVQEMRSDSEAVHAAVQVEPPAANEHQPYTLPDTSLFIGVKEEKDDARVKQEMQERARLLEEKLRRFGISGSVVAIKRGPVVTLFEYQPAIDTKLSKILALEDDLALALQALSIRILAPIPGTNVVGFEVANTVRRDVSFASIVRSPLFKDSKGALPLVIGEDTIGEPVIVDLARTPHLLIAGSTGSGKSVGLNGMLMSLLCRLTPDELKLILIDPKRLEFSAYADIAHLLFPIITHPKKATMALRWAVKEMERRYEIIAASGARNLFDYNDMVAAGTVPEGERLPFIVVVIDELADLMMTSGRECEDLITRLTQMARAAGIHLLVATQRPSVDIITGLIKVNFPSRISFRVTSKIDSRTILDCSGADKLLGRGDMLFLDATTALLRRVHGAFVSDKEIQAVVAHIKSERAPAYLSEEELQEESKGELLDGDDALYEEVLHFLSTVDEISISLLQRRFRIGYNRSARIIDILETQGHILPADGGKTRKVVRS